VTFEEAYALGADPTWRARCQSGALKIATNVMSEDDATVGHAERATYANRVLLNPSLESQAIAYGVAAQPAITGPEATDSDIEFTISAMFNAWAGVP
jgi:hypothetical protein